MRQQLQGKPLKWKVQAVNTLTAVLLVLLSCIIAYSTIVVPSQSLLRTSIANSLAYSANTLGRDLVAAETLSNLLYSDSVIQSQLSYLSQPAGITVRLNAKNRISSTLLHYVEQYSFLRIKHITIDSDALFCSTNETAYHQESDERHAALMEAADQADGALVIRVDAGDESRLQMIRKIREIEGFSLKTLGYITLCIDMNGLIQSATSFASTFGETGFVLLSSDEVIYKSSQFSDIDNGVFRAMSTKDYHIVDVKGQPFFCVAGQLDDQTTDTRQKYDWNYYCLVSYEKVVAQRRYSYLLYVAILLAVALIFHFLASRLLTPILGELTHLVRRMQRFNGTDAPVPEAVYQHRQDEVAELHRQFESMGNRIHLLIKENYEKELLAKATELHALMMQVNPHFLYNVLDSINWRAQSAGLLPVCRMASALGSLLRESIGKNQQMIPLREELSLVAHYVEIQKIRFEDCLEYRAEIDDTLSAVEVPRLSIQPLVDNAIRYGMEGQYDEVCRVTLSIRAEGADTLVICVMNTGSAFEPDLLKRLASHELQPRGTGIGLLNIDKRLRLLYGTEGHLLLLNEDGLAKAMIRIPMQKRATEETAYAANDHCG